MTTMTEPATTAPARALRRVLLANAGFSTVTGFVALVAAEPLGEWLGVDQIWLIRLVGAALIGFAAFVAWTSTTDGELLRRSSALISTGDLVWVAATPVVIALGWLSTDGALTMSVVALAVLAFGIGQLLTRRALSTTP
ncbi:MAG: hypothetical protein AAF547_16150 [Actinomycetota bacterium]